MRKLFGVLTAGTALLAVTACDSGVTDEEATMHIVSIMENELADQIFASRISYEDWADGIELPSEINGANITYEINVRPGTTNTMMTIEDNVLYYAYTEGTVDEDDIYIGYPGTVDDPGRYTGLRVLFEYEGYTARHGYDYEIFSMKEMTEDDYNDVPQLIDSAVPHYVDGIPYISVMADLYNEHGWRVTEYRFREYGCSGDNGSVGSVTSGLVDGEIFEYRAGECFDNSPGQSNRLVLKYTIERFHPAKPEIYREFAVVEDSINNGEYQLDPIVWPNA